MASETSRDQSIVQTQVEKNPKSECIFQHSKYTWYTRIQVPKLFKYVVNGSWDKIPKRAQTHPLEAKFVHLYPPNDTALHRIVRVPEDAQEQLESSVLEDIAALRMQAIHALLRANPNAITFSDYKGQTPLHLACKHADLTKGAAELMITQCPEAAKVQDVDGKTPLHYLVEQERANPPLLQLLVSSCPSSINIRDKGGKRPIDLVNETQRNDFISLEKGHSLKLPD